MIKNLIAEKSQRKKKRGSASDKFHSSNRWTETARAIKERDHYLCQACLHNLDGAGVNTQQMRLKFTI